MPEAIGKIIVTISVAGISAQTIIESTKKVSFFIKHNKYYKSIEIYPGLFKTGCFLYIIFIIITPFLTQ